MNFIEFKKYGFKLDKNNNLSDLNQTVSLRVKNSKEFNPLKIKTKNVTPLMYCLEKNVSLEEKTFLYLIDNSDINYFDEIGENYLYYLINNCYSLNENLKIKIKDIIINSINKSPKILEHQNSAGRNLIMLITVYNDQIKFSQKEIIEIIKKNEKQLETIDFFGSNLLIYIIENNIAGGLNFNKNNLLEIINLNFNQLNVINKHSDFKHALISLIYNNRFKYFDLSLDDIYFLKTKCDNNKLNNFLESIKIKSLSHFILKFGSVNFNNVDDLFVWLKKNKNDLQIENNSSLLTSLFSLPFKMNQFDFLIKNSPKLNQYDLLYLNQNNKNYKKYLKYIKTLNEKKELDKNIKIKSFISKKNYKI